MRGILLSVGLISGLTLLTNLLGFVREILFARAFGATQESDCFVSAFSIVATCFLILTAGSLQGAFMPRYQEAIVRKKPAVAKGLWRGALGGVLLFSAGISLVVLCCADQIVALVVPGFEPHSRMVTSQVVRWLVPMILACSLGSLFQSILHAHQSFALPALVPVGNNIIIIGVLIVLAPVYGLGAMSGGVVVGALVWFLLVPFVMRYVPRGEAIVNARELCGLLVAVTPLMALLMVDQIAGLIQKFLVSDLDHGSISVLNYAARLQGLPVGILAGSLAAVMFPSLVEAFAKGDRHLIDGRFKFGVATVSFLLLPSAAFLIGEANLVVRVLLERGSFSSEATTRTAAALQIYSVGLLSQGLIVYLNRVYFAKGDTRTPMIVGMVTAGLHILVCWIAVKLFGYIGIAIGTSLYAFAYSIALLARLGETIKAPISIFADAVWRPLLASLGMLLVLCLLNFPQSIIGACCAISISCVSYMMFAFMLRDPSLNIVRSQASKIRRQFKV